MKSKAFTRNNGSRRHFIGGSDARIIMSPDEAALIRLWKEKRGEAEPEDLQLGVAHQGAQLGLVARFSDRPRRFRCLWFAQTHSVSGEKIDAGASENTFDHRQRILISRIAADLDVADGVSVKSSRPREVSDRPVQSGARHPHLCTCHRHLDVPLSHVPMSHLSISANKRGPQ